MSGTTNRILIQLAHSTLLPPDMSANIFSGQPPTIENVAEQIVIGAMDAHVMTVNDPASTWNHKRLARMVLAVAFLSAIASTLADGDPECSQ